MFSVAGKSSRKWTMRCFDGVVTVVDADNDAHRKYLHFCILQSIWNGCLLGIRNFCMKKAVHWYCTNKPPLRIWRAYFDSPLPFWYNLLLIVASKLWGRWTLEFSGNNFAAYFYWQLHIRYRISYTKSSCISPTKQKAPLTRSEVSGKWKHSHKAAIIMKIALRFRKAIFGAPSGTRTQDPLIKSQLLYQLS